jgi:hypothetical protein
MKYILTVRRGGFRVMILKALQQYFSYVVVVSFLGGENRSNRRKPLTSNILNLIRTDYKRWIFI